MGHQPRKPSRGISPHMHATKQFWLKMPGWRQKRRTLDDNAGGHWGSGKCDVQKNNLATGFIEDWCWGLMTGPKALKHMRNQILDQGDLNKNQKLTKTKNTKSKKQKLQNPNFLKLDIPKGNSRFLETFKVRQQPIL